MKPMVRSRSTVMRSVRETPGRRLSFISISLVVSALRRRATAWLVAKNALGSKPDQSNRGKTVNDSPTCFAFGSGRPHGRPCAHGGAWPDGLSEPDHQVRRALSSRRPAGHGRPRGRKAAAGAARADAGV